MADALPHWTPRATAPPLEAAADPITDKILDGAISEIAAVGFRRLTLVGITGRAGVARMSVYRRFADLESLLDALAQRETARFYRAIAEVVARSPRLDEQIVESFVTFLGFVRTHPILRRTQSEPVAALDYLVHDGGRWFRAGRDFIAAHLRAQPRSDPQRAALVAETLVRLAVSFVLPLPSTIQLDDEAAARDYARAHVIPMLAALARPPRGRATRSRPR